MKLAKSVKGGAAIFGRTLETNLVRELLTGGVPAHLVGRSGVGKSAVALAASEGLRPLFDRVPPRAGIIPLGSAYRWINLISGRKTDADRIPDPPFSFVRKNLFEIADILRRGIRGLNGRPLILSDIDSADGLSINLLSLVIDDLYGRKAPIVVTSASDLTMGGCERIVIHELPRLFALDILAVRHIRGRRAERIADASQGIPALLLLAAGNGKPAGGVCFAGDIVAKLRSSDRKELAMASFGEVTRRAKSICDRSGCGTSTGIPSVLASAGFACLSQEERKSVFATLGRKEGGVASLIFRGSAGDRKSVAGIHRLGQVQMNRGNASGAASLFELVHDLAPGDLENSLDLAEVSICEGSWRRAEELLLRILDAGPRAAYEARAHAALSALRRRFGFTVQDDSNISKAMTIAPDDPRCLLELAIKNAETGEISSAREIFLRVSLDHRSTTSAVIAAGNLAFLETRARRYKEAEKFFTRAVKLAGKIGDDGRLAVILLNRSHLKIQTRSFRSAISDAAKSASYSRILGLLETEMRATGNLAEAFLALKKYGKAEDFANRTIQLFGILRGAPDAAIWAYLVRSFARAELGRKRASRDDRKSARRLARATSRMPVWKEASGRLHKFR